MHDLEESQAVALLIAASGQVEFKSCNGVRQGIEIGHLAVAPGQCSVQHLPEFIGQSRHFILRSHRECAGNLFQRFQVIRFTIAIQTHPDRFLDFVQAGDTLIEQLTEYVSLFLRWKRDKFAAFVFLYRFAQQLDVNVEDGLDFQQFLSQRQQWRIEIQVGDVIGDFKLRQQVFNRLCRNRQVEHIQRVSQLAQ